MEDEFAKLFDFKLTYFCSLKSFIRSLKKEFLYFVRILALRLLSSWLISCSTAISDSEDDPLMLKDFFFYKLLQTIQIFF